MWSGQRLFSCEQIYVCPDCTVRAAEHLAHFNHLSIIELHTFVQEFLYICAPFFDVRMCHREYHIIRVTDINLHTPENLCLFGLEFLLGKYSSISKISKLLKQISIVNWDLSSSLNLSFHQTHISASISCSGLPTFA
jgi:hypothetical protein